MSQILERTPSIHFNFQQSNQKTNDKSFVPFDYSFSNHKIETTTNKKDTHGDKQPHFQTPPSYIHRRTWGENSCQNPIQQDKQIKMASVCIKLNTDEFFEEFESNFVVNFGDSSNKACDQVSALRKTSDSYPAYKDSVNSKVQSYISEPLRGRRRNVENLENEEDIGEEQGKRLEGDQIFGCMNNELVLCQKIKNRRKLNYEIRKRVQLKNNEKFCIRKMKSNQVQIINKENLITFTSKTSRKQQQPMNTSIFQPKTQIIHNHKYNHSKLQLNIFNKNHSSKDTLRTINKDNWKKKHSLNKQEKVGQTKFDSIFQRPLSKDV